MRLRRSSGVFWKREGVVLNLPFRRESDRLEQLPVPVDFQTSALHRSFPESQKKSVPRRQKAEQKAVRRLAVFR